MDVREAIYHASKILRRDFKDIKTKFAGYTPVYSFNTEDSASVFHHFRDYIKGQKVLTVTGSGDAIFDLLLYGAKKIVAFDVNKLTIFYSKLKIAFIKSGLDKKMYTKYFMGMDRGDTILDYDIYELFKDCLDPEAREYWDGVYEVINKDKIVIRNTETSLMYEQFGLFGFPNINCSIENKAGYFTDENYEKIQKILREEDFEIEYKYSSLFDLDDKLNDKFAFMYLSNIMDYTSEFIDEANLDDRLVIFKNYVTSVLSRFLKKNGIIVSGFLRKFRQLDDDIHYDINEYKNVFFESEGFFMDDCYPTNIEDRIIIYSSPKVIEKQKELMYDYY
ncbi:MAG: DUF3419 family protein [Erysipelotrichales bacterium]|nr:DUF3419 family protein [Erysipelotrichales bacterium]